MFALLVRCSTEGKPSVEYYQGIDISMYTDPEYIPYDQLWDDESRAEIAAAARQTRSDASYVQQCNTGKPATLRTYTVCQVGH